MQTKNLIIGYDIGGTKCAVLLALLDEDSIKFICREQFKTFNNPFEVIYKLIEITDKMLVENNFKHSDLFAGGISCGGPLDDKQGIILSPPNLPNWDNIEIVKMLRAHFNCPFFLKNDADACSIAEWKYGAGKGYQNIIFLTFGTGLGAGLILNNKPYSGSCGMAGEVGHIRLRQSGPIGYGKSGSFEGFCSGGGIIQIANKYFNTLLKKDEKVSYYNGENSVDAKLLFEMAEKGDAHAVKIFNAVGKKLGLGLSILIDILNPEVIILGGIYMRANKYLTKSMMKVLKKECLAQSLAKVKIKSAELGEKIGDYGAIVSSLGV